jgi:hypothetical protein
MGNRAVVLASLTCTVVAASACGSVADDGADTSDAAMAADVGVGVDAAPGATLLVEDFAAGSAGAWPSGWSMLGGVASATLESGRGRLVPVVSDYTLARMGHALPGAAAGDGVDVEVAFTLVMAEPGRQGVGVYVRQNGGYLRATATHGAGYAVFVEAFRGPQLGLWRERDGVEEPLRMIAVPALDAGVTYAVRFRCAQDGASTSLAARIWRADAVEPSTWTVTTTDATPALQAVGGGVAVDAWNTVTPGNGGAPGPIHVDDIVVRTSR